MKAERWLLFGILAVAAGIRLHGLNWGLPMVYEEAYPFKKAWDMWGWGQEGVFDPNPHFFNYPTLFFYVQFIGQALTYLGLRLLDVVSPDHPWAVGSTVDFRALYLLDKTPFYLVGRGISLLFGVATVGVTWMLGRRTSGVATAAVAALLVALNQFHIAKSQVIEVDVPLTLFVLLTGWFALRITELPSRRNYLLAGLFCGLATSTKYSGGLLPLGILVAHFVALHRMSAAGKPAASGRRDARSARRKSRAAASRTPAGAPPTSSLWVNLVFAGGVAVLALLVTSPYILLDSEAFWIGFNYERQHMAIGHFGLDDSPAILYYARVLANSLLGWPLALGSLAGLVYLLAVRRSVWAAVLSTFPLVYVALISSWSMKAERYVLPLMPIAGLLLAGGAMEALARWRRITKPVLLGAVVGIALVAALPNFAHYNDLFRRARGDTRTLARDWLEEHAPDGSFLVTEAYGPEPFHAIDMLNVSEDLRERIVAARKGKKMFAYLQLPMLQVKSEVVSVFYDLDLYAMADYVVTSTAVSGRYRAEPGLYAPMLRFYDDLERRFEKVATFGPEDGAGPQLTIYRNPNQQLPFRQRPAAMPPVEPPLREIVAGTVGPHYQRLAANYEMFGFYEQAARIYELAGHYPGPGDFGRTAALSAVRSYLQAKKVREAYAIVQREEATAPNDALRSYWRELRNSVFTLKEPASTDSTPP